MNKQWISHRVKLATLAASIAPAVLNLSAGSAHAQNYPGRPVNFVVPFGPGSGNDVIARIVAQKVSTTCQRFSDTRANAFF